MNYKFYLVSDLLSHLLPLLFHLPVLLFPPLFSLPDGLLSFPLGLLLLLLVIAVIIASHRTWKIKIASLALFLEHGYVYLNINTVDSYI